MITREFIDEKILFAGQGITRGDLYNALYQSFRLAKEMNVEGNYQYDEGVKLFLRIPEHDLFKHPKMIECWLEYSDAVLYSPWWMGDAVKGAIAMASSGKSKTPERFLFEVKKMVTGALITIPSRKQPVKHFDLLLYYFGVEPLSDEALLKLL